VAGAFEIKDHNSGVRMSLNAQGAAFVDAISSLSVDDNGGSLTVDDGGGSITVDGTINTIPGMDPSVTGVYGFTLVDAPGVATANTYLSIFNPVGSGKVIALLGGSASSYVTSGGSTTKNSLLGSRITTATVGTLQAASAICEYKSSYNAPIAEVRTGNPTVTLGANFMAVPPPVNPNTNSFTYVITPPEGTGAFTLVPGEGVAIRSAAGDTDQNWNINVVWAEI